MTRPHPSMPFFPADFFADTEHVSGEAARCYLFLLGHAWMRDGKLPNDARALARMARVGLKLWESVQVEVLSFWQTGDDGFLHNKRLEKELAWVACRNEINQKNGFLGGRHKTQKSLNFNNTAKANGFFSETETKPPNPNPIKEDSLNELRQKKGDRKFVETETEQWNAWAKFYQRSKGEALPQPMRHWESRKLGWYFETEWPPGT